MSEYRVWYKSARTCDMESVVIRASDAEDAQNQLQQLRDEAIYFGAVRSEPK